MSCHACQQSLESLPVPLSFRETCPKCHRDAHVCLNCQFYSVNHRWECRESSIDERVADKEKFNFCSYFALSPGVTASSPSNSPPNDLRAAAEALFKKKP